LRKKEIYKGKEEDCFNHGSESIDSLGSFRNKKSLSNRKEGGAKGTLVVWGEGEEGNRPFSRREKERKGGKKKSAAGKLLPTRKEKGKGMGESFLI